MIGLKIFIITFILIYLLYFIFVISREKALLKWQNGKEMTYLKKVYKVNIQKKNLKSIANVVALANAFIVSTSLLIASLFSNFVSQMLIGFVAVCSLILLTYHIIGKYCQSKNRKK